VKKTIFFFSLLGIQIGFSQVLNIEKFRPQSDSINQFMGNVELGFDGKKQKISTFSYNTDINAAYLSKIHDYLLLSTLAFNQVEGTQVTNQGYVHVRLNFWRKNFISLEQFSQIQFDAGRGLEKRQLIGGAARFNFIKKDKINLSMNIGTMVEHEIWFDEDELNEPIENIYFKSSNNLTLRYKLSPNTTFFLITFYQARPESFFDPRITLDSYLKVGITKKLALGLQYDMTYDTNPPITIAELIYSFKTNLVYKF